MAFVGHLPWPGATGGDVSPDGSKLLIRGYANASLWQRPADGQLWQALATPAIVVPLVAEPQGEAICFDADGLGYYTTSEGAHQPIHYFRRLR